MVTAISISGFAFWLASRRKKSLTGVSIQLPDTKMINLRLIIGSMLFGIGWGIAGICPGPAITLITISPLKAFVFILSMLLGMFVLTRINSPK